jgi:hypothetical protein
LLSSWHICRGVAQLVEQRSPKAKVAGSIPAAPAKTPEHWMFRCHYFL